MAMRAVNGWPGCRCRTGTTWARSVGYQGRRRHFTKNRSVCTSVGVRQSKDSALAESKNASFVRKGIGASHIPQKYAAPITAFS